MINAIVQSPSPLNYASRQPTRWWRRGGAGLLLIGCGVGIKTLMPPALRQLEMLNAQTACANFDGEHANKSTQDAVAGAFMRQMRNQKGNAWGNIAGTQGNFIFVGMLRNKNGERLLFVRRYGREDINLDSPYLGPELFHASVLQPGTLFRQPKVITDADVDLTPVPDPLIKPKSCKPNTALWVGVRDAGNRAEFSILFSTDVTPPTSQWSIIKGWLDDQDQVHLSDISATSLWKQYQNYCYTDALLHCE